MELESGQVAVVTGGASGIGLALARKFGRDGLGVVIADIEQVALDEAASGLADDGIDVLAVRCDVADADSVAALADESFGWKGRVDVVCNNAGVVHFGSAFGSLDDWKWVIDVDLWGVVHGCHAFVPRMIESGRPGHVINTASTAGLLGFPNIASYVAAKHAVVGLSQSMHFELESTEIGISVLCPGVVSTNITTSHRNRPGVDPGSVPKQEFGVGIPETLTPGQVADVVVDAVEADRFWILPHPHYGEMALDLARTRIDGTPPVAGQSS